MKNIIGKLGGLFVTGAEEEIQTSPLTSDDSLATTPLSTDAWDKWEASNKAGSTAPSRPLTDVINQQPGPNLDSVSVQVPAAVNKPVEDFAMPKKKEDGTWDFTPVYLHSNLQPPAFTAEQARDIIATLPTTLPIEIRRETVSKTIGVIGKTLGITPEIIAADAALKIAAVSEFKKQAAMRIDDFTGKADSAIKDYERKIEEAKKSIAAGQARGTEIANACDIEIDKLDDVTEFFTLDQGSSNLVPPATPPVPAVV